MTNPQNPNDPNVGGQSRPGRSQESQTQPSRRGTQPGDESIEGTSEERSVREQRERSGGSSTERMGDRSNPSGPSSSKESC
jgi:hypothetical protein